MPRIQRDFEELSRPVSSNLTDRLAAELKDSQPSGQPRIDEELFQNGNLRVVVLWDEWDRLSLEERTAIILRAYEKVESSEFRDKIALASGLTFPEAYAAGMLPFQIIPAVRASDRVKPKDCSKVMIDEGASTLLDPDRPQLRFATQKEADEAVQRLIVNLPHSEPVWIIQKEVGRVEDWSQR